MDKKEIALLKISESLKKMETQMKSLVQTLDVQNQLLDRLIRQLMEKEKTDE